MKKSISVISAVLGMTLAGTAVVADESTYVPWTFDDFNADGEVIETDEVLKVEVSTAALEVVDDDDVGELGW
jgi:hypothetical protein